MRNCFDPSQIRERNTKLYENVMCRQKIARASITWAHVEPDSQQSQQNTEDTSFAQVRFDRSLQLAEIACTTLFGRTHTATPHTCKQQCCADVCVCVLLRLVSYRNPGRGSSTRTAAVRTADEQRRGNEKWAYGYIHHGVALLRRSMEKREWNDLPPWLACVFVDVRVYECERVVSRYSLL